MTLERLRLQPSMEGPATYRIHVLGHLDESWSSRMGGMKVIAYRELDDREETILQGKLADQAALTGVLNTLYELHLPVISAQFLDEDTSERKES